MAAETTAATYFSYSFTTMKTFLKNLLRLLFILFLIWCFGGLSVLMFNDIPLLITLVIGCTLFVLPTHRRLWRPQKWWAKIFWRLTYKLGVITAIFLTIIYIIPPFPIAKHTTYLTEPRATKHYGIDYAAVFEKQLDPGVPLRETGLRVLVETFGKSSLGYPPPEDYQWNRLCRFLDLPPEAEPKCRYVMLYSYAGNLDEEAYEKMLDEEYAKISDEEYDYEKKVEEYKEKRYEKRGLLDNLQSWYVVRPYPEELLPMVRDWLAENDAALDTFAVILEKPILHAPATLHDMCWRIDTFYFGMPSGLLNRIQYRLAVGEIDRAWDDVLTLYRLADRYRYIVWNELSMFYALRYMETANRCAEAVLRHSEWTSDEIRRKMEEIAVFQQPFTDEEGRMIIRGTRMDFLAGIQYCVNDNDLYMTWFERNVAMRVCRLGNFMTEVNRHYDKVERRFSEGIEEHYEAGKNDLFSLLKIAAWNGPVFLVATSRSSTIIHAWNPVYTGQTGLSGSYYYQSPVPYFMRHETDISLTRLVFLLEAYSRQHGNYPETLDALGDDLPLDPFSGKPFRYAAKPSEDYMPGFLLYSVGQNGIDDGGRDWNDKPEGDDIHRQVPPRVYVDEKS